MYSPLMAAELNWKQLPNYKPNFWIRSFFPRWLMPIDVGLLWTFCVCLRVVLKPFHKLLNRVKHEKGTKHILYYSEWVLLFSFSSPIQKFWGCTENEDRFAFLTRLAFQFLNFALNSLYLGGETKRSACPPRYVDLHVNSCFPATAKV